MGERIARDYKLRQLNLRIADDRWIDRQNRRFVAGHSSRWSNLLVGELGRRSV